jgi:adenylate cyclase
LTVGFADMVGFTLLSQHLQEDELGAVVQRFEDISYDTVGMLGGRVVKMIGDEVMFVVDDATAAIRIGLALAEAYADDDLLSDVRVGLAMGPVLVREGDYFGATVNLASRIVNIANPGTVLVSESLHERLNAEAPGEFSSRPLGRQVLKGIGPVRLWWYGTPGRQPDEAGVAGAAGRGNRLQRLNQILQELGELRGFGEKLTAGRAGLRNRAPVSVAGEPGGGDPEGT